jgi:outer membrane protein TolC
VGLERIGSLVGAGVRSGLRSPADSIRLGLALEDAALDVAQADADREAARLDLLAALGRSLSAAVTVRDAGSVDTRLPLAADSLELLARVSERPEVALARLETRAAELDLAEARRRASPEVTFKLDAGLAGTDLAHAVPPSLLETQPSATFRDRLRRDLGASAALNFHLPLFDAARAPAISARLQAFLAAHARDEGEEARQQRDAAGRFLAWRSAAGRVRATESIVGRAESHFLRTKSLYAAGATTLFDVLDALQLLKDSRLRHAEAAEELRLVRFQIEDRP